MNSNAAPHSAPSRLASSRLKNPKLWHASLPVTSVANSQKPVHKPTQKHHKPVHSSFQLPPNTVRTLPFFALSFSLLLGLLFVIQPSQIQNLPLPDWYGPFHALSFMTLASLLFMLTTKLKTSLSAAAAFQTLFFFKLQHIELTPIVLLCTLILFGTIGLSAHIIQIFTGKHKGAATTPTLHTLN